MSTSQQAQPEIPPHVQIVQMASAYWVSKIIYAAAKLGLADHLAAGPKSAEELAGPTGTHAPSLHRLMRTLASLGVLTSTDDRHYALTPLGESLQSGAPGSARSTVMSFAGSWFFGSFQEIMHSLKTGGTGFEAAHGMPVFDFLGQHPEEASLFSEAMVGLNGPEAVAVAESYDFSGVETIVDVGGATGNMLAAILSRHEGPRGILFDMEHVVADAPALLQKNGVADRVTIESGSFFESIPGGSDVYILSHIIHDWDEDRCLKILSNVRAAMKPDSRLLIVECVLAPGDEPDFGKILDIVMLVCPGGQERTAEEYDALLSKAGLRMTRVIPTESVISIVEAVIA